MPRVKNALLRYRVIDKCLRNKYKPYPSKQDLRHACEDLLFGSSLGEHISDSTIEKDLYAMRMEHDAPIKYSKRFDGYYYTDATFSMSSVPLSEDDIESIKFAASTLAQFKDTALFKQFGFTLGKILDRVAMQDHKTHVKSEEVVQFETGVSSQGSELLSPLLHSIEGGKVVYFYYESFLSGERKKRKVTPLLLKEYRNRWYVITYDMVKKNVITYGLDRMSELEESEELGLKPPDFNPDIYFKYAAGITVKDEPPQKVVFYADSIAAKYIQSQPFHLSQCVLAEGEAATMFELNVILSEELIRDFLSYGAEIRVESPKVLQDILRQRHEAAYRSYLD
jgi:predicted DNA-binding transcriptional regulator YafY